MTTYLGLTKRTAVAVAISAVLAGAAISAAIPAPCYGDDGYRCVSEAEYADVLTRLDVIRSERSGDRFANTCAVVEHGPTGPEPTVNLGRTVTRCADGTTYVTEWSY